MPRPSQEDKIVEAALECFAAKGYDATTIRHIALKAGVTEGAIYRHYASKEEIAQHLYSLYMGLFAEQLQQIAAGGFDVKERLLKSVQTLLSFYRQNQAAATFAIVRQHNFMPALPKGFVYPLEIIEKIISEGQAAGLIRAGRPNLLAAIFLGCVLRPIILSQLASPGAFDLVNETEHDNVIEAAAWAALKNSD